MNWVGLLEVGGGWQAVEGFKDFLVGERPSRCDHVAEALDPWKLFCEVEPSVEINRL